MAFIAAGYYSGVHDRTIEVVDAADVAAGRAWLLLCCRHT